MKALCVLALGCLTAVSLWAAASATGEWAGEMDLPNGNVYKVDLILKASGSNLTGTISRTSIHGSSRPVEIGSGSVKGNTVAFNVVRNFRGHEITNHYQGTMDGDAIHFTITQEGGVSAMGQGQTRKLDLNRVRH